MVTRRAWLRIAPGALVPALLSGSVIDQITDADGLACVKGECQYQTGMSDQRSALVSGVRPSCPRTEAFPSGASAGRKPKRVWRLMASSSHCGMVVTGRISARAVLANWPGIWCEPAMVM